MRNRFVVLDPAGDWLQQWQHQFAAYNIPHLRSPVVHHPDPDPHALRTFAESRSSELFPPYDLPGTQLFHDFCQEVIRRWELQERVISSRVQRIELFRQQGWQRFRLGLADGGVLTAKRVVLDARLRWGGRNLFIMGGAAALQLGPVARNLFGARLASNRIVPALIKDFSGRSYSAV